MLCRPQEQKVRPGSQRAQEVILRDQVLTTGLFLDLDLDLLML